MLLNAETTMWLADVIFCIELFGELRLTTHALPIGMREHALRDFTSKNGDELQWPREPCGAYLVRLLLIMPLNPYKSPQTLAGDNRLRETVRVPAYLSLIVVPLAAIAGVLAFFATHVCMGEFGYYSLAIPVSLTVSCGAGMAAVYSVQMAADAWIHKQQPPWVAPFIGMLAALPVALVLGISLAVVAYSMGNRRDPQLTQVALCSLGVFFLTLSVGSWFAVCRALRVSVVAKEISN